MRRYIIFLFFITQTLAGLCASSLAMKDYVFSYLTIAHGLPGSSVRDLFRDSYGFVWMCTHDAGVVRYDGYTFRSFGLGGTNLPFLSNSSRSITEDSNGRLWIAFDEGTQVIDLKTLLPVTPKAANEKLTEKLQTLLAESGDRVMTGRRGELWVLTRAHIYNIGMDQEGKVTRISGVAVKTNPNGGMLRKLDNDGSVYVACASSLWHVALRNGRLSISSLARRYPMIANRLVNDVVRYRGKIYFATNNGLFRSDGKSWKAGQPSSVLPHDIVTSLLVTSDGRLLVGTLGGVAILYGDGHPAQTCTTKSKENPLSSDLVSCMKTTDDILWIGTQTGGVVKVSPRLMGMTNYVHSDDPSSISPNAVNAMFVEDNGTIWAGTVEGGLNRKGPGESGFRHFTSSNSELPHNSVSVITADDARRLWLGTWGGGLAYVNMDNPNAVHRLSVDKSYENLVRYVGVLVFDSHNNGLWVGADDGLFFYSFDHQRMEDPFPGCRSIKRCMGSAETADGRLWVGCADGLVAVDLLNGSRGNRKFIITQWHHKLDDPKSTAKEKIISICPSHDGTLWLGSYGYGLYKMMNDSQGRDSFVNYSQRDGLANNVVRGIVEDQKGQLWLTTDNGLSVMQPHNGTFANFDESDGLPSAQFYFNSAELAPNGSVFLGSNGGITEVRELKRRKGPTVPLRLTRLTVGDKVVEANSDYLDEDIALAKEVRLHESDQSFTLEFAALNYGPEKIGSYFYRMRGYEKNWKVLPPGMHSVHYSDLPTGHYVFEVRYVSGFLNSTSQMLSVNVVVRSYFWKRWWFVLLVISTVFISVYGVYVFRKRRHHDEEVMRLYLPLAKALQASSNPEMLQKRMQTLIDTRQIFDVSLDKRIEVEKEKKKENKHEFVKKALKVMEENYTDPDFGVTEFCAALKMSRVVVNKKLKEEIGMASSQFIRDYRLEIAHRRIVEKQGNVNVSDLAYSVGFNDPKYFTRCYTKYFGAAPTMTMNNS